jgi:hypothetical protein
MGALALFAAYITRRAPRGASITAPLWKLVGLAVLGVVLVLAVGQAQTLLGIDSFNADAVQEARTDVRDRTNEGNSTFTISTNDFNPARFPSAAVSVLFRPFPWQARNAQAMIASLEGLALLACFVVGWRRLAGALRSILHTPYVVLCLTYSVLFIYGFSSFANFGILVRQRVQVLPFVLVLLCLPPLRRPAPGDAGIRDTAPAAYIN